MGGLKIEVVDLSKVDKKELENRYSYSNLTTFNGCEMEWKLNYIDKEEKLPNAYGLAGGIVHDKFENMALGKDISGRMYDDIIKMFSDNNTDITNAGRDKWHLDIRTLGDNLDIIGKIFKDYNVVDVEREFLIKCTADGLEPFYMNGYIDIILEKDGEIYVYDWKTSSIFNRENRKKNALQLLLYKEALEASGMNVKEVAWVMVKYVDIKIGNNKKKRLQLNDFPEKIKQQLYDVGMTREEYTRIKISRKFSDIPEHIMEQIEIYPHILTYNATDEEMHRLREFMYLTVNSINRAKKTNTWQYRESDDLFYCEHLCGYRHICPMLSELNGNMNNVQLNGDKFASKEFIDDVLSDIFD